MVGLWGGCHEEYNCGNIGRTKPTDYGNRANGSEHHDEEEPCAKARRITEVANETAEEEGTASP